MYKKTLLPLVVVISLGTVEAQTVTLTSKSIDDRPPAGHVLQFVPRFVLDLTFSPSNKLSTAMLELVPFTAGWDSEIFVRESPDFALGFGAALLSLDQIVSESGRAEIESFTVEFSNPDAPANQVLHDAFLAIIDGEVGDWSLDGIKGTISVACDLQSGSLSADGRCTDHDIDALSTAVRGSRFAHVLDLNFDFKLDDDDRRYWVQELMNTSFGDANLDGKFNSSDLVQIFQRGEYQDDVELNSGWADGDWNGDGDFNSADLVLALAEGSFDAGQHVIVTPVPEPSGMAAFSVGLLALLRVRRLRD